MAYPDNARLDMIEPGRFFVIRETELGGVTGRAFTSAAEALQDLNRVVAAQNASSLPFPRLAA